MHNFATTLKILSVLSICSITASCGNSADGQEPDAGALGDAQFTDANRPVMATCIETGECVTILDTGEYTLGDRSWPYHLLRLGKPDGNFAYAMWLPPPAGSPGGAVMIANPYDGIDWSGEEVDTQWATTRGSPGCYDDLNGPGYVAGVSAQICYRGTRAPVPSIEHPDTALSISTATQAAGFLLNDIGALVVFGRFYAGGSALSYIDSMVAGLQYLSVHPEVDKTRVGVFGVSLGGFEALHGAARSPATLKPLSGVGFSPLVDFESEVDYVVKRLPSELNMPEEAERLTEYTEFFEPYLRRIYANSGGPGPGADYSEVNRQVLSENLDGEYLIIQDEWDTLVPVTPSLLLTSEHSGVEGFWFPHTTGIDYAGFAPGHQQASEGQTESVSMAFTYEFLLTRLAPASNVLLVLYEEAEFRAFFDYIRMQEQAGAPIDWLVPRLIELSAERVVMADASGPALTTKQGYEVVGQALNDVWGAGLGSPFDSATVISHLEIEGL